jgi:hypothetical protein
VWVSNLQANPQNEATEQARRTSEDQYEQALGPWDQLAQVIAQLMLVGSDALTDAADDVFQAFESMRQHLRAASGGDDPVGAWENDRGVVERARTELVAVARHELGRVRSAE